MSSPYPNFAPLLAFILERLVETFLKPPLALGIAFSWSFALDLLTPLATAVGAGSCVPWADHL